MEECGEPSNFRVDWAARFHSTFAALMILRNTLKPLAAEDLFGAGFRPHTPFI